MTPALSKFTIPVKLCSDQPQLPARRSASRKDGSARPNRSIEARQQNQIVALCCEAWTKLVDEPSGMTARIVADLWARLLTERLGYEKFAAHGGDIGARVTNWLGLLYADKVIGVHAMATPALDDSQIADLSEAERAFLDYGSEWMNEEGAYSRQQRTRPQTLAYGLNDSSVGLAAWILEKWRAWSDCGGDIDSRFTKDELLTQASLYWFTETIGSSVRMYFEHQHEASSAWPDRKIEIPARLFLTTEKVDLCPEEWAARIYARLSYGLAPKGGHFLAAEEPQLLAEDIRAFFRPLRSVNG